jgi:hypothetical protein
MIPKVEVEGRKEEEEYASERFTLWIALTNEKHGICRNLLMKQTSVSRLMFQGKNVSKQDFERFERKVEIR